MSKKGSADLVYILGDALRSLRENVGTTILTSFTLAFSLAIFSLFVFIITNLNAVVEGWGERTQMIVYVKDASVGQADSIKQAVLQIPGVKSAEYVSKEKALAELKEELKGHESILDGVDANPLPASFEVRVEDEFNQPARIAEVAGRIKALEWAEDVQYSREWVEKLSSFIRFIQLAAIAVGVFLGAATLFIISNTIRLAVYARKDEIEIMKLVGASDMYVKTPFVLEGLLQGFFGGLLALCVLALGRYAVLSEIPSYLRFAVEMPFSAPVFLAFLIGAGMLMGVAGSLISMNRFLKV
jgi:cell division transport system permease protein